MVAGGDSLAAHPRILLFSFLQTASFSQRRGEEPSRVRFYREQLLSTVIDDESDNRHELVAIRGKLKSQCKSSARFASVEFAYTCNIQQGQMHASDLRAFVTP